MILGSALFNKVSLPKKENSQNLFNLYNDFLVSKVSVFINLANYLPTNESDWWIKINEKIYLTEADVVLAILYFFLFIWLS